MGDHERTLQIEDDDIGMKTKSYVKHFVETIGTLSFIEKPYFNTLLSFTPYWEILAH